jgi:hypothetical protein
MDSSVSLKGNTHEKILMNYIHFANLLTLCENNSRIGFCSQVCYLFQDDWELAKFKRSVTCEVRKSVGASVRKLQCVVNFLNEASEVKEKPSKRCLLKSPGLKCELVASL